MAQPVPNNNQHYIQQQVVQEQRLKSHPDTNPYYANFQPPQQHYVVTGQPMAYGQFPLPSGPPPPDRLILAIFTTLCCNLVFGVIAIITNTKAQSAWRNGDQAMANQMASITKWMVIASVLSVIFSITLFIVMVYTAPGIKEIMDRAHNRTGN